ncbi:MAG: phosphotransferase [Candidatus Nephthysia bennettiae]|uniref:Phosphotransferase n=1 Tax=Candidatus Nephthysia bennettiae TaxID=3127016 RepID=A0A934N993_9BACT|nr:phosphotransferase [Candidatus Dormibacteraeota bacterium]PZR97328.1 MAG: phosphotransferase [Candidatus Dormibacteraeota bacterium]
MILSRADLHIHTSCSDGAASPVQIAATLVRSKLAVASVTDHDTVEGSLRVREALRGEGPEIIVGAEVTTADGHLLAVFIERDVPSGLGARETVELIHEQGGLAIGPHPYFPWCSLGELAGRLPLDAIETANGTPLGELANRRAARRLGRPGRALVGGSDAHVVEAVGHVQTLFPGRTGADLRHAIESGHTRPVFHWKRHLEVAPIHLARVVRLTLRGFLRSATGRKQTITEDLGVR